MEIRAKLSNLRIAPRKVRLVADAIRGKRVKEAQAVLRFTVKKSSMPMEKLLNSAVANAKNNFQTESDNLYISKITVDEGAKYKRWMPRARGSASEIQKKTSHITLILDEISKSKRKKENAKKEKKSSETVGVTEEIKTAGTSKEIKREWKDVKKMEAPKTGKGMRKFFQRKAI